MHNDPAGGLPPGPRRPALLQTWAWIKRPGPFLDECRRDYGDAFTIRFVGGRRYLCLSRPEHVREVLTAPEGTYLAGRANRGFKAFLGEHSLFVLDGEPHKRHRRILRPSFRGARMGVYAEPIREMTWAWMDGWRAGTSLRLEDAYTDLAQRVIFAAVFGVTDAPRARRLSDQLARLAGGATALMAFLPVLQRDLGRFSPWGRYLARRRKMYELLDDAVAQAREGIAAGGEEARQDILARILLSSERTGQQLTTQEIRDELVTLYGAGHETTTAGLLWASMALLGSEELLARARAELKEVTGGAPLAAEHVPRLRFLGAVIDEA
ncbi:MAG: cytochrome P450, partial [Planctomycetota bacterium]